MEEYCNLLFLWHKESVSVAYRNGFLHLHKPKEESDAGIKSEKSFLHEQVSYNKQETICLYTINSVIEIPDS